MPPFAVDVPPKIQERVVCSISAAVKYEVPANIVLAVAEKEDGKPGQWVRNRNGTYDIGPMQFNTSYLTELAKYGITANDVAGTGCYSFDLAAWRLRMHMRTDKGGDLWTKVANYHSRTPQFNATYRADLMRRAAKWGDWLQERFVTLDVTRRDAHARAAMERAPGDPVGPRARGGTTRLLANKRVSGVSVSGARYVPRSISFNSGEGESPR